MRGRVMSVYKSGLSAPAYPREPGDGKADPIFVCLLGRFAVPEDILIGVSLYFLVVMRNVATFQRVAKEGQ